MNIKMNSFTWFKRGLIVPLVLFAQLIYAQSPGTEGSASGRESASASKGFAPPETRLPVIAVKSNLLYDLTTTINLGLEIGLSPRLTLDIPVNYNAWKFSNDMRLRHWGVQPELRYWTCQRFDGWFIGLHGHYARFNVGAFPDWSFISENMQKNRYEGDLYGAGVSAGYSWILKKRWSMEATLGVGYARLVYEKYPCTECGTSSGRKTKNYFGPTKVGISLIYMIK